MIFRLEGEAKVPREKGEKGTKRMSLLERRLPTGER